MKRRLVAVTLSLVMTMATVSEAGAATFTSPDGNSVVAVQAETETDTEPVDAQSDPEASSEEDIFSAGDETTDVPSQDQTEDVFSAGNDVTSQPEETPSVTTDTTDSSDAVVVKAEDWVNTENGFKLRKPAQTQTTVSGTASEDASASYTDCGQSAEVVQGETEELSQDTAEMDADGTETPDNTDAVNVSDTEPASTADTTDVTADEFYSAADGIVKVSTEYKGETHTGYYLFDENGILVTGQAEVHQDVTDTAAQGEDKDVPNIITEEITQSYFTTAEEAVVYAGCEGESVTPYTSTVGQQEKNIWKWTGTQFQYYDENGKLVTVSYLEEKAKAAGTYTGYFEINGKYYCLDANGKPKTGEITITANGETNLYYFDPASTIPGEMFHKGWLRSDTTNGERWLYFQKGGNGNFANIGKYYKRGVIATVIPEKGTGTYLLDANGYVLKSTMKKASNGSYYCTDKNGAIYKDKLVKYGNYRYYFGSTGKRATWTRRWAKVGNHYYYFGSTPGRVVEKHGWQKLVTASGKYVGWLYFDAN